MSFSSTSDNSDESRSSSLFNVSNYSFGSSFSSDEGSYDVQFTPLSSPVRTLYIFTQNFIFYLVIYMFIFLYVMVCVFSSALFQLSYMFFYVRVCVFSSVLFQLSSTVNDSGYENNQVCSHPRVMLAADVSPHSIDCFPTPDSPPEVIDMCSPPITPTPCNQESQLEV